jgi:hypothetical protein
VVRASTGGGGGSGGGSSGGGGGGGGGGDGDDGEKKPEKPTGGFRWKGWEDRVAADPQFAYKVFIEQVGGRGGALPVHSWPCWLAGERCSSVLHCTCDAGCILRHPGHCCLISCCR